MIGVGQLTDRLLSIRDLPTFPTTALEVMRLASDSDSSAAELAKIISKDPALATKILRVANSPYYGFARKISTIEWAIVALGFESLRETILSLTLIDLFKGGVMKNFDPRKFWKHAIDTGTAGRSLARELRYRIPGEAYAAGLLHDIGTLVLYRYFHEDFEEISRLVSEENLQPSQAEVVVTGTTHGEIGAWLASKWNFPAYLVEAIQFHHAPAFAEVNPELTAITHVASLIASSSGYSCADQPLKFDMAAVQLIGVDKLGISIRSLAEKYIGDDASALVKVRIPVTDYVPGAGPEESQDETIRQIAEEVDDGTLKRFFKDAIKLLPSTERLVVTLKLYEGLELRQVATVLGYDEAKVAEYYKNAVSALQQMAERAIITNRLDQWKMRY
jgi:putative nucleotidyltransferase with HDIG domain